MIEYDICDQADKDVFEKQCRALEMQIPGLRRQGRLNDVDGTIIQSYTINGKAIVVRNDETVGAVTIESDIPLEKYFGTRPNPEAQAI